MSRSIAFWSCFEAARALSICVWTMSNGHQTQSRDRSRPNRTSSCQRAVRREFGPQTKWTVLLVSVHQQRGIGLRANLRSGAAGVTLTISKVDNFDLVHAVHQDVVWLQVTANRIPYVRFMFNMNESTRFKRPYMSASYRGVSLTPCESETYQRAIPK